MPSKWTDDHIGRCGCGCGEPVCHHCGLQGGEHFDDCGSSKSLRAKIAKLTAAWDATMCQTCGAHEGRHFLPECARSSRREKGAKR